MGFAKKALGTVGTIAGGAIGGPIGASVGGGIGNMLAGVGAGQQQGYQAYNPNEASFQLTPEQQAQQQQDMAMQGQFVNQLQGQVGGYDPLIGLLSQQAQGQGPSFADMQLQDATNRNIQQQMGQAAASKAVNPALAARMAGQNVATLGQDAAAQSAQVRLAEMLQAQQQEIAARQAQSGTSVQGGNLASTARGQGLEAGQMDRDALIAREKMLVDQSLGGAKIDTDRYDSGQDRKGDFFAGVGAGMGSLFGPKKSKGGSSSGGLPGSSSGYGAQAPYSESPGMSFVSDRKAKTDIKKESKSMDQFLDALSGYSYRYKDGDDRHVGVMTQDLEKSDIGKLLVTDTKKGKAIDMQKALSAVLAAQAHMNKKLKGA